MILYVRILELEEVLKIVRVIFGIRIRDYKTHLDKSNVEY